MVKQLNVRSERAYEIARRLALRTGRSRTDVVVAALLRYDEARTGRKLTAKERAFVDELMALARHSAAAAPPTVHSDQRELYDKKGMPV